MITAAKKWYRNYLSKYWSRFYLQLNFVQYILGVMFRLIELTASFQNAGKVLHGFQVLYKLNYMEPHFIILIPCSGGCIYKWEVFAFYSQLSLIYLSKQVHLQSALSVGYRQADINEAFRFIRLSGWWATRGSIDFVVLWFIFFSFFLDHNERHAWRISQFVCFICQAILFFPGKSSYLNWPQELPLSDFNAPHSVDSISITPVTKA